LGLATISDQCSHIKPGLEQHLNSSTEVDYRVFWGLGKVQDGSVQKVEGIARQRVENLVLKHPLLRRLSIVIDRGRD
jgi:hypothetical protein